MSDQLRLGDAPKPTGPTTYTLERHAHTKRYFALSWADGWVTGIAGPFITPLVAQELPELQYDHNETVIKHITQDILNKLYIQITVSQEVAS